MGDPKCPETCDVILPTILGALLLIVLGISVFVFFFCRRQYRNTNRLVDVLDDRLERAYANTSHERSEKEKALTRLSEVASERLRDNNPAIADLSDVNRPTKLGEQMSELYDNEWTAASVWLETTHGLDERKSIDLLHKALMDVYTHCQKRATEQLLLFVDPFGPTETIGTVDGEQTASTVARQAPLAIKDIRKKMSKDVIPLVEKAMVRILNEDDCFKNFQLMEHEPCKEYVLKCTELCWLMCVQDPPVVLDNSGEGRKFNTKQYKTYTRTGPRVEFVLWPMLRLHENGPLLCKGVAQGGPTAEHVFDVSQ